MRELCLTQPGFSAFGLFVKHCFAYSESKDLARGIVWDKGLKDRAYEIAINFKYDGYQRGLISMAYRFFEKGTGPGTTKMNKVGAIVNEVLSQELHKQIQKTKKIAVSKYSMLGLKIIFGLRI